jgi:hypothetical protein
MTRFVSKKRTLLKTIWALFNLIGGLTTLYLMVIRPWHLKWGTTSDEAQLPLPGDEFVPDAQINATHAITIAAPIDRVWPWIAQIGQGRGGFYSYDFLENLMGLDIHTADQILPEYQDLKVGALIPLASDGFGVPVAIVEPPYTLVAHGDTRVGKDGPPMRPGDYLNVSWGWYLNRIDDHTTRFVERWRAEWGPGLLNQIAYRVFLEPGAFIMERKMLLGLKQRAEKQRLG